MKKSLKKLMSKGSRRATKAGAPPRAAKIAGREYTGCWIEKKGKGLIID